MIHILVACSIAGATLPLWSAESWHSEIPHYTLKDTEGHFDPDHVVSKITFDRALLEKKQGTEIKCFQQRHFFKALGFEICSISFDWEPNSDNTAGDSGKKFGSRPSGNNLIV